ncbi:MAG: LysM peptidoglycan-binding domain-containing protein, partial [Candidatus Hydrogenedentes bacterium]|nr:LysM peptidoglycan-binding domain-containing protein [Candidatus Hydrogenedentota bacterium]
MSDWMGVAVAGFGWVVANSWRAAVLVGVVLVVQRLLRGRLAAKWQYALWLLVVARLMVPPGVESTWSMFNWVPGVKGSQVGVVPLTQGHGQTSWPWHPGLLEGSDRSVVSDRSDGAVLRSVDGVAMVPRAGGADRSSGSGLSVGSVRSDRSVRKNADIKALVSATAAGNISRALPRYLPLLWLAGVAALAVLLLWANLRLLRAVRAQRPVLDPSALGLLEACKERMGIRTPVALIGTNLRGGPALFGFVRPRLLVPEAVLARCDARELQHIFLHELAHLKRNDILMNWLVAVLQVLHWFNPVLWFAFHRMRADRELACDALALAHMEEQEARAYGQTILGLLDEQRAARPLAAAVGILEDKAHLKRRIAMIATFTKPKHRWTFVGLALAALLAGAALTDAQQDSPAPASTPESAPAEAQFPPQEAPAVPVATAPTPVGQAGLQVAPPVLPGAAAATVEVWKHTVQEGETVEGIAEKYGLSVEDFRKWNSFDKGTVLKIGQQCDVLIIKAGEEAGVDLKAPPRLAANAPLGTPVAPAPTVTAPGKSQPEVYQNLSINHELEKLLETPVSIEFEDIHLSEIVQFMSESYGINIVVDTRAVLPRQPKSADGKVERFPLQAIFGAGFVTDGIVDYIKLEDVALKSALEALLRPLHLDYALRPGFLFVSSPQLLEAEALEPEIGTQPWQGPQAHLFAAGHRDGALGRGGLEGLPGKYSAAFQQLFGSTTQGPRELLARSQNNLKQCGIILKMYAGEHKGKYPALSPEPGVLMFDAAAIFPEY